MQSLESLYFLSLGEELKSPCLFLLIFLSIQRQKLRQVEKATNAHRAVSISTSPLALHFSTKYSHASQTRNISTSSQLPMEQPLSTLSQLQIQIIYMDSRSSGMKDHSIGLFTWIKPDHPCGYSSSHSGLEDKNGFFNSLFLYLSQHC